MNGCSDPFFISWSTIALLSFHHCPYVYEFLNVQATMRFQHWIQLIIIWPVCIHCFLIQPLKTGRHFWQQYVNWWAVWNSMDDPCSPVFAGEGTISDLHSFVTSENEHCEKLWWTCSLFLQKGQYYYWLIPKDSEGENSCNCSSSVTFYFTRIIEGDSKNCNTCICLIVQRASCMPGVFPRL